MTLLIYSSLFLQTEVVGYIDILVGYAFPTFCRKSRNKFL